MTVKINIVHQAGLNIQMQLMLIFFEKHIIIST